MNNDTLITIGIFWVGAICGFAACLYAVAEPLRAALKKTTNLILKTTPLSTAHNMPPAFPPNSGYAHIYTKDGWVTVPKNSAAAKAALNYMD